MICRETNITSSRRFELWRVREIKSKVTDSKCMDEIKGKFCDFKMEVIMEVIKW